MARIFHTADWHLGARLVEHDRYEEHALFLTWLVGRIRELKPDLLIIAGDIFDSANPPQLALSQYYGFLASVSSTSTEVLVVGGNHDSAMTLNAPRDLLRSLRINVIGSAPAEHTEAIFELGDAVVCAVPFLRERDVRRSSAGESYNEVAAQIREGIARYYREILDRAFIVAKGRPIIATGHLTAIGIVNSGSERAIHVGNLGAVSIECFAGFDYVALGHIHGPQSVGGLDHVRYSGSPLALGFDEIGIPKQMLSITTNANAPVSITPLAIPQFRRLLRLKYLSRNFAQILEDTISEHGELMPWVELTVEDGASHPDLDFQVKKALGTSPLVILKLIVPRFASENDPAALFQGRMLTEIKPEEVFAERLRREGIDLDSDEGKELEGTFAELLSSMTEEATASEKVVSK